VSPVALGLTFFFTVFLASIALASRITNGHALAAARGAIGSPQHVGAPGNVRGATANPKLTFQLDHSAGADHCTSSASCAGA
jgi:hypothetical protein